MKITNTTYTCDMCGAEMPHPAFVKPTECGDYRYDLNIRRKDMRLAKGFYTPPYKSCHVCEACRRKIAELFRRNNDKQTKANS